MKNTHDDVLLKIFFESNRWENAIQKGVEKEIDNSLLRELSSPQRRIKLYHDIKNSTYVISPPHEAKIPKDDGTFRTVYVNEGIDRVILAIINDMFFELCPELIHPRCKSYQKGLGCGKTVQEVSRKITETKNPIIGKKIDLSKYFDSVPIAYIDKVFDYIHSKFGESKLLDIVVKYYHTNTVIDIDKNIIEKYSSLRQGCAIAAFLADAVLYDIDDSMSKYNVFYTRYSDDIIIIGDEWEQAYTSLQTKLAEKTLILNPKKVETLYKDRWFKFLGFNIKGDKISLSKSRVKTFQKEIEKRTLENKSNQEKTIVNAVNQYLYQGNGEYSWATSVLPVINVEKDIQTLNSFVMDAIRAGITRKKKIGGLGSAMDRQDVSVIRGKGKNVTENRKKIPYLNHYSYTIMCMRNAMMTSRQAYDTLVNTM